MNCVVILKFEDILKTWQASDCHVGPMSTKICQMLFCYNFKNCSQISIRFGV